ncbi:hypothetical protein KSP40_PGU014840 [Platanthera guangdongensis]|uniref:Uncharacterized protein n=1 Tax=Platanthera guangdongensis TaxID=2320717 RepID=A0ABR2M1I6_9ASPA
MERKGKRIVATETSSYNSSTEEEEHHNPNLSSSAEESRRDINIQLAGFAGEEGDDLPSAKDVGQITEEIIDRISARMEEHASRLEDEDRHMLCLIMMMLLGLRDKVLEIPSAEGRNTKIERDQLMQEIMHDALFVGEKLKGEIQSDLPAHEVHDLVSSETEKEEYSHEKAYSSPHPENDTAQETRSMHRDARVEVVIHEYPDDHSYPISKLMCVL